MALRTNPFNKISPYLEEELEHFKNLIYEYREQVKQQIDMLQSEFLDSSQAENDSAFSFHMADAASDNMGRERTSIMIERQISIIKELDKALERIRNKTFGICKITGRKIRKDRLEAIPYTEICVEAARFV